LRRIRETNKDNKKHEDLEFDCDFDGCREWYRYSFRIECRIYCGLKRENLCNQGVIKGTKQTLSCIAFIGILYIFKHAQEMLDKDKQQREVDFVLKRGLKIEQLIQVTYASGEEGIEGREKKALIKASEELKCDNMLVITWDYEAEEEFGGKRIKFTPVVAANDGAIITNFEITPDT
jgi:hypothetical protein